MTGRWFSLGTKCTLVSSTNKTDHHDITNIVGSDVKHHSTNLHNEKRKHRWHMPFLKSLISSFFFQMHTNISMNCPHRYQDQGKVVVLTWWMINTVAQLPPLLLLVYCIPCHIKLRGCHDRIVVGFITSYAISVYYH